jgi:hypothetical protein
VVPVRDSPDGRRKEPQVIPSRTAALICGALVAVPLFAGAEDKVQVVVVPYAPLYDSIPRATGERIAETLQGELGTVGVEVVALPGEAAPAAVGPSRKATDAQLAAIETAKADLESGKGLLQKRKVKPALDAFDRAIAALEGNSEALMDVSPLVDAHMKRAVALFRMGKEDVALKEAIPTAIRLKPTLTLEAGDDYAPVFIAEVEKVRKSLFTAPMGSLRVDTTPPGAGVWIDDRESSTSPALAKGLIPGTHFVRIKPPGGDFYVQTIEIKPNAMARISPDAGAVKEGLVTGLVTHLSKNDLGKDTLKQLKAVAAKANAPLVLIGGAFAQGANMGIVSFVYSAKKDALIELSRVTLDREMLGATIEINKLANEVAVKAPAFAEPIAVPRALAADAKAGEELVNEVDFTPNAPPAKDQRPGAIAPTPVPAKGETGPATPAGGGRRPVITGPRKPVGATTPGNPEPLAAAPTAETAAAPAAVAVAVAAPAETAQAAAPAAPAPAAAATTEAAVAAAPAARAPAGPATKVDESGLVFKEKKPAEDFKAEAKPAEDEFKLDFDEKPEGEKVAEKKEEPKKNYKYLGGGSIEDEQVFDPNAALGQEQKKEGGLLSKWWFWAGAAAVAGGVATVGVMAGGGDDPTGAKGTVKW